MAQISAPMINWLQDLVAWPDPEGPISVICLA